MAGLDCLRSAISKYYSPRNFCFAAIGLSIWNGKGWLFSAPLMGVVSAVYVNADTGQQAFANSFFEIKDGKIWKLTEFWGAPYDPPEDRRKFASRY
jgi:hypothetical protein